MKTRLIVERCALRLSLFALVPILGCATQSISSDRLKEVAIVSSGDTNVFLLISNKIGPIVSATAVDGRPTEHPYGPIELTPGFRTVTLKLGDVISDYGVLVDAGDVYQFGIMQTGRRSEGILIKVRGANK